MIFWSHRDRTARMQRAAMQEYGLRVVTDTVFADEPIQLADAYAHLRIYNDSNGSADDTWLQQIGIPGAREWCEGELGRSLATKTLERSTNKFPTVSIHSHIGPAIDLAFGPVQSITSVSYKVQQDVTDTNGDPVLDSNGDPTTEIVTLTLDASTYELDSYSTPNRLILAFGKSWPTALDTVNSVKVRYVAGYVPALDSNTSDDAAVLPNAARIAMLLMLGHLYENRESSGQNTLVEIPAGAMSFLDRVLGRERLGMA